MAGVQPCKPSSCAWTSNQAKGNIGELISIWAPYPQYTHRMEASTTYSSTGTCHVQPVHNFTWIYIDWKGLKLKIKINTSY